MSASAEHNAPASSGGDEEYEMPCAEALLAGTLALMTGHAQSCCDDHRDLMARKVATHLSVLSQHPVLSPGFKSMLFKLQTRWANQKVEQMAAPQAFCEPDQRTLRNLAGDADSRLSLQVVSAVFELDQQRVLWHKTPETAQ